MRALQVSKSSDVLIQGITITDSQVSSNHLMYFTGIKNFHMRDVVVRNITKSIELLGFLSVVKIEAVQSIGLLAINHINITNLTYSESQMSFFDIQSTQPSPAASSSDTPVAPPSVPQPGDISVRLTSCVFQGNTLSDKLRMFTTQDIKNRNIIFVIQDTKFLRNVIEKGYLFEFRHNFRQVTFVDCIIENNNGYFLEADPSDQ